MLPPIFNPPKNKFEKYWFFDLIKMVLWNWYIYIFYVLLKIYVFFYNFYQKLKIFIKKQRRYEFLKIIVFWLNGLKILRHEVPTVHCSYKFLMVTLWLCSEYWKTFSKAQVSFIYWTQLATTFGTKISLVTVY